MEAIKTISLVLLSWLLGVITCMGLIKLNEDYDSKHQEPVMEQTATELNGWQLLQMAIIMTESNFDDHAIGRAGDYGVMQITKVYVDEVNRILDTAYFKHTDAFCIQSSLDMFGVYQEHYNAEHDVAKAIRLHNPKGDSIGYEEKVMRNFLWLSRMEEVRNKLVKE